MSINPFEWNHSQDIEGWRGGRDVVTVPADKQLIIEFISATASTGSATSKLSDVHASLMHTPGFGYSIPFTHAITTNLPGTYVVSQPLKMYVPGGTTLRFVQTGWPANASGGLTVSITGQLVEVGKPIPGPGNLHMP